MQPQRTCLRMLWVMVCLTGMFVLIDIGDAFCQESAATGVAKPSDQEKGSEKPAGIKRSPTSDLDVIEPPVNDLDDIHAGKKKSPTSDLYSAEPTPLSPVQCGQCHSSFYRDLKTEGGRHQFQCQNCHKNFHAYSPVKKNWQELMPKCRECHVLPHGEKITDCLACHSNPHAPTRIPMTPMLLNSCVNCHNKPGEQLKKFPSAHTKLSCGNCHTKHGYIPSCNACHKPHYEAQDFKSCTSECHQVHMPLKVTFKKDANARTCGACHEDVYAKWTKTPSKHGKVNCAMCHSAHGYIPACTACHALIHSKQLHERFPKCLTCHQDPHDLPVKQRSK